MFAKRFMSKGKQHLHSQPPSQAQDDVQNGGLTAAELHVRITVHYGIPYTASTLAFDPVQRLLAIGTLDGRIKIVGGDNIEALLISPKKLPFKNLEFLCNKGFLVAVSNENDIQVWDLKHRLLVHSVHWECNVTAFSIIRGTYLMYIGDDEGSISVLKYDVNEEMILQLPYHIPMKALTEAAGLSFPNNQSVVGILPQPSTLGSRILIAYDNGVIILWDISEERIITWRGHSSLQLDSDEAINSPTGTPMEHQEKLSDFDSEEKEICSLCWASSSGSILAVGYIDGDILLWNLSSKGKQAKILSNNVVKLQLSSSDRRLPVIVLHWSPDIISDSDCGGRLFVYGGDETGSEEVLTVLHLDWPSGADSLNCVDRVDLTLNGSFADMVLIPKSGISESSPTEAVLMLTNPGQLHVYDGSKLSSSKNQVERYSVKPENIPVAVPTVEPHVTVTKIVLITTRTDYLETLLEKAFSKQSGATPVSSAGTRSHLTGGIPSEMFSGENIRIEKMYIAGYKDGSIRIWDATNPVLRLIKVLEGQLKGFELAGEHSPVSALDFCSESLTLAAGNESGLVRIYKICDSSDESTFRLLIETKLEVHTVHNEGHFHYTAGISVVNSPVQTLQFVHSGARLAAGYKTGMVMMIDTESLSVLYDVSCSSDSNSGIISIATSMLPCTFLSRPDESFPENSKDPTKEVLFILTRDAHVVAVDSVNGNMISTVPMHPKKESVVVSMHIIGETIMSAMATEQCPEPMLKDTSFQKEREKSNRSSGGKIEVEKQVLYDSTGSGEALSEPLLLLCCEDALRLYSLQSVIGGNDEYMHKVDLAKPCCWSATFKQENEGATGLILLYQTGVLEIRSLPNLEVLEENTLMSILRWGYKTNMSRTLSSSVNGQISLINGCELAFLSTLACENDFRIPESLPSLHDDVLAAAADAAISHSTYHKKKQSSATSSVFGGIIKGFKEPRAEHDELSHGIFKSSPTRQLEEYFSKIPFSVSLTTLPDAVEELNIDDIEIGDPLPEPTLSRGSRPARKDERTEREKLFEGATTDHKPRLRTPEEILTKYKFGGDAAAAAAHARDKLVQRQEKLQRTQERTEELKNRAEDFDSMAKELVKAMEKRKWWQL